MHMAAFPGRPFARHVLAAAFAFGLAACARPSMPSVSPENQMTTLETQDLVVGQGAEAMAGSTVTVHYTGWLYARAAVDHKGQEFDSSRKGGAPFSFVLGQGRVIAGWDQGVAGMRAGGQRRLVIPASLAYGERGAGGVIPPGATLVFDVDLLAVHPPR